MVAWQWRNALMGQPAATLGRAQAGRVAWLPAREVQRGRAGRRALGRNATRRQAAARLACCRAAQPQHPGQLQRTQSQCSRPHCDKPRGPRGPARDQGGSSQALNLLGVLAERIPLGGVGDGQALDGAGRAVRVAAGDNAVVSLVGQPQLRLGRVHRGRDGRARCAASRRRRAPAVGSSTGCRVQSS